MKVVMDSDCLIKLTKAGLKERVCGAWEISVPAAVRQETVDAASARPDAERIRQNIEAGHITVLSGSSSTGRGEDAVLRLFKSGGFDAVATDDTRFIRRLRGLGVAYAVPGVIVVKLRLAGSMGDRDADQALEALRPHISPEEYAAARLMLSGGIHS
jgi:rRNA-processing protein FCF1